ncbi:MAG: hypothetical protein IID34_07385 [Planctomycetes bacterium]|nr:hypothetical protein [Planctomycetota bacterium]
MSKKTSTHHDLIEITTGLRNFVDWMAETIQAEGLIPTKIFVAVGGIEHPDHAEEFRYNRASALKMRRLLLRKAGSFGGSLIVQARQAGGLSEHAELIDDTMKRCEQLPIDDRHREVFLSFCRHVLPLYDPTFELRAIRTKTLADAYLRALRMLAELIQSAEAPPQSKAAAILDSAPLDDDIPPLDEESDKWILAKEVGKRLDVEMTTLSNDRITEPMRRSEDKRMGIDRRGRMWRKKGTNDQKTWYFVSSLSSETG